MTRAVRRAELKLMPEDLDRLRRFGVFYVPAALAPPNVATWLNNYGRRKWYVRAERRVTFHTVKDGYLFVRLT